MNAQQLFDMSASHLLSQKAKSAGVVNGVTTCKLHGDGLQCAIGCLIPSTVHTPAIEGFSVLDILASAGGELRASDYTVRLTPNQMDFFSAWIPYADLLYDLQCTHDASNVNEWELKLHAIAHKYGLSMSAISHNLIV